GANGGNGSNGGNGANGGSGAKGGKRKNGEKGKPKSSKIMISLKRRNPSSRSKSPSLKWSKRRNRSSRPEPRPLKRSKRRNRSLRSKPRSLKRWKFRKPAAEFSVGPRCIGIIRPVEPSMGARCIGIRAVETRCPLICAVAVETAKTHGRMQLRRTNFFQFIILWVSK